LSYNQNAVHYHINLFLTGDSVQLANENPSGGGDLLTPQGFISQLTSLPTALSTLQQCVPGARARAALTSGQNSLGRLCVSYRDLWPIP
jgi:hypothetical protein